jgi:glycosyltransferase involved in cell wall biosynthesis
MKILSTGMGWIEHTPGGLNRYFADYMQSMRQAGHSIKGLMTTGGAGTAAPGYIREVLAQQGKQNPFIRARAFRNQVKREMLADRPDVLNPHFALYASLITRGVIPGEIPIVTHFHGPWARESLVEDKGSELAQRLRYGIKKQVEQLPYRRSDRFIVLSRYFHDILASEYGIPEDRIHIIPGAVDTGRFKPAEDRMALRRTLGIPEGHTVLFCARRLVNRMGIDRLIQAMPGVTRSHQNVLLCIAGDGPLRQQLKDMIEERGLAGYVRLLGRVSNEELVSWYQAADMSIVPTLTLEGFGLVSVEALACGTPVLGTPYGGTREILPKLSPELLFADSSPEAMEAKLLSVLSGELQLPARESCTRHVMQLYTWDRVADSVTQVFEQAVMERKSKSSRYAQV